MTSVENTNYTKHKTNKIDSIIKTEYNQVLNDLIDINNNSNLSNQRKDKEFSNIAISCMVYLHNNSLSESNQFQKRVLKRFNNIKINENIIFHFCWGISNHNTEYNYNQLNSYVNSTLLGNIDIHCRSYRSKNCNYQSISNRLIKNDHYYCKDCKNFLNSLRKKIEIGSTFGLQAKITNLSTPQLIEKVKILNQSKRNLKKKKLIIIKISIISYQQNFRN